MAPNHTSNLKIDLSAFEAWMRRSKADTTVSAYSYTMTKFMQWLGGKEPDAELVDEYITHMIDSGNSNASAARHFAAIKLWFKFKRRKNELEYIEAPRPEKKTPRHFTVDEVILILKHTPSRMYRTAFLLQYAAGLRFGELQTIDIDDIHWEENGILVSSLKKKNDSTKDFVPLDKNVIEILAEFVNEIGRSEGPLFMKASGKRLHNIVFNRELRKSCDRAGVDGGSSHALRHGRATDIMLNDGDIFDLRTFMRHSNIQTTMLYAHITGKHVRGKIPQAFRSD